MKGYPVFALWIAISQVEQDKWKWMTDIVVCQGLLHVIEEILLIVVIQIEFLEEEGIPMREVDLQKERDIQVEIEDHP